MTDILNSALHRQPSKWLITGAAGFIGSNLLETLLRLDQTVVGLDDFSTGKPRNLADALAGVSLEQRRRFHFIEGSITDPKTCAEACAGVDYVLHQAALGSVQRSIEDPVRSHASNVNGFLNMLVAARAQEVRRLVYASSSSVYGSHPGLPKVEETIGQPLSPYAVTKRVNELYAAVFFASYGLQTIGLRYFNVFGPRQDPDGPYAAVIPRWVAAMIKDEPVLINGDGSNSRDFCYVANAVQANLLAATCPNPAAVGQVFNIACHARTTLLELFELLRGKLRPHYPHLQDYAPVHQDFRAGDIRHSQADITKASDLLGYTPSHSLEQGLDEALEWYERNPGGLKGVAATPQAPASVLADAAGASAYLCRTSLEPNEIAPNRRRQSA